MIDLDQALSQIAQYRTDEVVVATMSANLIWPSYSKLDADLLFTAPMGGVPGVALGIALARPDARLWLFNGDGCTVMYLGSLISIAGKMPPNLVFFLMDNREWGRVGHLPLPAADSLDFAGMARCAGWQNVHEIGSLEDLASEMPKIKGETGPVFVDLRVTTMSLSKSKKVYKERMGRPEAMRRYGRDGIAAVQAYLAQGKPGA
ncbi:MAG: hypothetical protein HYX92_15955 [Chloroflexi bacterium]|nr:hypothetical protein [Chloroflexota bacterium]